MPYTSLILEIKDEEFLREHDQYRGKKEILYAQDMFLAFAKMIIQKTEFKVLYVGQAFGKEQHLTD